MSIDFRKYRTDAIFIAAFAVISLLYCYPQLQGKVLKQLDNVSWKAMSHEAMAYHEATGKDVLWSNSMFGGMPTYTTYVGASNVNYPAYVQTVLRVVGKPAYFFFIAMVCFYLLARVMGVSQWLSAIGGFAYAFASNNPIIIMVGHETKMLTIGYLPAALAGFYLIFKEKWLTGAALFALAIALIATNNHFQMMYYFIIILLCFAVVLFYEAVKGGRLKQFFIGAAIALGSGLLGLLPNLPSVLTTQEYAKETMRGGASELKSHDQGKKNGGLDKEYAFRWSMGLGETFCFMIPYLYGGATYDNADLAPKTREATGGQAELLPIYWGERPTQSGPVFFGAVVCFLFVLGMFVIKSPHKWWMFAASLIGTVLAYGKNLEGVNYFLFDHVPMLNKFRTVEMALIMPQFMFPMVGVLGLKTIIEERDGLMKYEKDIFYAAAITGGLCLVIGLLSSVLFDFSGFRDETFRAELVKVLKEDRASLAMSSALKSAFLVAAAAGALWLYIKNKLQVKYLVPALAFLVIIDIIPVALNYMSAKEHDNAELNDYVDAGEYDVVFEPRPVDNAIMQDPDPYYRVLDLSGDVYNDARQAYFHKCIGGYHPAKMESYQDLIERHMSRGFNEEVLNMLNTKYIIVGKDDQPRVLPNPNACGNAWFVSEIKWAETAEDEINALKAQNLGDTVKLPGAFEPRKTAVIRASFRSQISGLQPGKDSAAYIKLTSYGLDDLAFESENSREGLAVFSDIYYSKGWEAFVDGKETPILRANYVLRAVRVPAGKHKIEFHFRPASFYNSRKVAVAGSLLIMVMVASAIYAANFQKTNREAKT
ncbi:MAG: YfhO family protein [Taibaiella sp.]|nr:YfhO family protein [Taibaiella sp.]